MLHTDDNHCEVTDVEDDWVNGYRDHLESKPHDFKIFHELLYFPEAEYLSTVYRIPMIGIFAYSKHQVLA